MERKGTERQREKGGKRKRQKQGKKERNRERARESKNLESHRKLRGRSREKRKE